MMNESSQLYILLKKLYQIATVLLFKGDLKRILVCIVCESKDRL